MAHKPFTSRSREQLGSELSQRILNSELKIGEKLPSERVISLSTGLSRPVVREVLKGLVERGLIDVQPGRGSFVQKPSSINLTRSIDVFARTKSATPRDLVRARAVLEAETTALAAECATQEERLKIQKLANAFDKSNNLIDKVRCDIAFHAMIAQASHNVVLEALFGTITPLVFEQQLRSLHDPEILEAGAPLHHDIVRGIKEYDAETSRAAMYEHIALAREMFGTDLDLSLDSIARRELSSILGTDASLEEVINDVLSTAGLE